MNDLERLLGRWSALVLTGLCGLWIVGTALLYWSFFAVAFYQANQTAISKIFERLS